MMIPENPKTWEEAYAKVWLEDAQRKKIEEQKKQKEALEMGIPYVMLCPIHKNNCCGKVEPSKYLHEIFGGDKWAEWAANLVTHYRHEHIRYYDASWSNPWYGNKNPEYKRANSHDDFKKIINNRAKRQMIRAIEKNFPKQTAVPLISGFLKLKYNDSDTIELINKKLKKLEK